MESNTEENFNSETIRFLEDYFNSFPEERRDFKNDNDQIVSSAYIYEKIRISLEYQEVHLIFKNAISRILLRKYTILPNITAEGMILDLINELAWADYINPDLLLKEDREKLIKICERYLVILKNAKSKKFKSHDLRKTIINLMASEIDESFNPKYGRECLIDFASHVLLKNLDCQGENIKEDEVRLQIRTAVFNYLYKPDYSSMEYRFIKEIYPSWKNATYEQTEKIGKHFDKYYEKIDIALACPQRLKIMRYVKKNIAPFILIKNLPFSKKIDISEDPSVVKSRALGIYDNLMVETRKKVWSGTIRALIFIFLTKISLAFLLEIPFDRYLNGKIDFVSLGINIYLPTVLMLLAGTFVKTPPRKNREVVGEAIENILTSAKVGTKVYRLSFKNYSYLETLFDILYAVFSVGIVVGVIKLLLILHFNILSMALFFLFVSAVSFFAFRIRNMALELTMMRAKDDTLTSVLEFLLLPFIKIGKFISDRLTKTNPLILALDFLIEAPLKTIIKLVTSWFKFLRAKKEDIDF